MKINPSKCTIMSQDERHITLNDAIIDKVDDFVFLGSNVPSVVADVKRRIPDLLLGHLAGLKMLYGPTRLSLGRSK